MLGIIESRYAKDYIPKFQTKFHVPKEEPNGPRLGPLKRLGEHSPTVTSSPPLGLPDVGVWLAGWPLQNWLNSLNQLLFVIDK